MAVRHCCGAGRSLDGPVLLPCLQIPPDIPQHRITAAPAASARSTRAPNDSSVTPAAAASAISRGSQPPSGPTITIASDGAAALQGSSHRQHRPLRPVRRTSSASARRRLQQTFTKSVVSCTGGTTARPHCLTDEMTVRSHRSCRPPFATAFIGTSVRRLTNGCTADTPSMTASRITRSILSLFSNACASVTATRGSGAAARGSTT